MKIAQASLSVLHIRLHQIPALAHLEVAEIPLAEFGGDEFLGTLGYDLAAEVADEALEQRLVSAYVACLENCRQDRVVGLREPDALVDAACGVAYFLAGVPQAVEEELHDALHPR